MQIADFRLADEDLGVCPGFERSAVPSQPVVLIVKAYPDPDVVSAVRDRDGTVRDADPDRPELADRLEVE